MYALTLIVVFIAFGGNAEAIKTSQDVPFVMGGSQVVFSLTGIEMEEDVQLKCVIRFSDGRDSIVVEATLTIDQQSVICRLPPEIDSGSVVVDVEAANSANGAFATQSAKTVLLSEDVFINSRPSDEVVVKENWDTTQLSFTWDPAYFQQFFNPGTMILLQATLYAAGSMEPVFTATAFAPMLGMNSGAVTISVSSANIDIISNIQFPYFYVLRPVGTPSVYMSSIIVAPTLGMPDHEASRTCRNWLEIAETLTFDEINPCPPFIRQIKLDDNFIQSEYNPELLRLSNGGLDNHVLYYERVPTNGGHAQTCSYDNSTGDLATTSPAHAVSKYLSYQDNFFEDIWPYIVCCLQSNSQELCDLFHERRPIDTGHQYPGPEKPFCGCGDPHFFTFNDIKYDFMGNGEFWLIRGPTNSGFGVQGRMSPVHDWQQVSYFNAVAIKDGSTMIQIELKNYRSLHLYLNGVEYPIPADPATLPIKNAHIIINGNIINVRLRTGFSVIVENIQNTFLNVCGSGASRNTGKGFKGIFGNFGYDAQDDLTSQDGFVIPPTSANLLDLSLIHHRFGLTWMTTANESFFFYEDGKSWEDYANPDFGPIVTYPDLASLPEEVRAICGDSLFCYYEYMGTEDLEMAANVVRIEKELNERREELRNVERLMCGVVRSPANGRVEVNGYFNGSIASYSCNEEYEFTSGDRTRVCSASENDSYWTGEDPVCLWTCTTCNENTEFQLSHDPAHCSKFFLCSMGERFALECPVNRAFNPTTLTCVENYVCRDPPGC